MHEVDKKSSLCMKEWMPDETCCLTPLKLIMRLLQQMKSDNILMYNEKLRYLNIYDVMTSYSDEQRPSKLLLMSVKGN
jgi:hypothetical protein